MLRMLLTRRWLTWLAVGILFGVACFYLGRWQWGSYERQQTKIAAINANYDAAARPAADALPPGGMTMATEWTHVTLTGTYAADHTFLVHGRSGGPNDSTGYEVLVPLRTADGVWLVDRGWIPPGNTATETPSFGGPAAGRVTVDGWLRHTESDRDKSLPPGRLASINLGPVREQLGTPVVEQAYVVLGSESPAPTAADQPYRLPRAHEDLGPHQAYALQWWGAMPFGLVFVLAQARKEWRARQESQDEPTAASEGETPADAATGSPPSVTARPARQRRTRPRKVRIWDEEDE